MLRLLLTSIGATALVLPRHHKTLRSPRLATPNSDDEPTFASLAQLEARLSVLADGTSSKLRNYHDPTLRSFALEGVGGRRGRGRSGGFDSAGRGRRAGAASSSPRAA